MFTKGNNSASVRAPVFKIMLCRLYLTASCLNVSGVLVGYFNDNQEKCVKKKPHFVHGTVSDLCPTN